MVSMSTDASSDDGLHHSSLHDKIKIVSLQSTARPGCIIQLDAISDATHVSSDHSFIVIMVTCFSRFSIAVVQFSLLLVCRHSLPDKKKLCCDDVWPSVFLSLCQVICGVLSVTKLFVGFSWNLYRSSLQKVSSRC
jgi:hypothetical protein